MEKRISLEEMQELERDILREFVRFCGKNGLRYYIAYGTLLGAVRHHGFIPWDDDIDVMMPRPDYERFVHDFDGKISERYAICSRHNRSNWPYAYAKCIDLETELIETKIASGKIGVFLDVFPIDGLMDSGFKWKLYRLRTMFLLYCLDLLNFKAFSGSFLHSLAKRMLYLFGKMFGTCRLVRWIDENAKRCNYDESKSIGILALYNKCLMRNQRFSKEMFEPKTEQYFDGICVNAPHDSDTLLRIIYGDYMQLPPKDKRISNHTYTVRFINRDVKDA